MAKPEDDALAEQLGPVPDSLSKLSPPDREAFAALIAQARQGQSERLKHALKHSLDFIPPFLRGPVRSLFLK